MNVETEKFPTIKSRTTIYLDSTDDLEFLRGALYVGVICSGLASNEEKITAKRWVEKIDRALEND